MTDNNPVKLGLVGAGRWGQNYIRTIAETDGISLHRIASSNQNIKEIISTETLVSKSWKALIEEKDIDGLVLAVPPTVQPIIARAALRYGIPLLLEKPLALNIKVANEIVSLSKENDVFVMVDNLYLFHPAFKMLKEEIESHGSSIISIESVSGNYGPFRSECPSLWDWGPHDVSMCFSLVEDKHYEVSAYEQAPSGNRSIDGKNYIVNINFSSGIQVKLNFGNLMAEKIRLFNVTTDRGEYIFNDLASDKLVFKKNNGNEIRIEISDHSPLHNVVDAFVRSVKSNDAYSDDLENSIDIVEILERIQSRVKDSIHD